MNKCLLLGFVLIFVGNTAVGMNDSQKIHVLYCGKNPAGEKVYTAYCYQKGVNKSKRSSTINTTLDITVAKNKKEKKEDYSESYQTGSCISKSSLEKTGFPYRALKNAIEEFRKNKK